jgi:hypothetical protein
MPKNIHSGDGYRILVISGPLTALSGEFQVVHGRRRIFRNERMRGRR